MRCWLCLGGEWHREQAQHERHDAPDGTAPHGRLLTSAACRPSSFHGSPTVDLLRVDWLARRRDGGCCASAPVPGSSKPHTRQECSLSLRPSIPSTMSSFSHGQPVTSRRERSHDPTASTNDHCASTQWQGRAYPTSLCP